MNAVAEDADPAAARAELDEAVRRVLAGSRDPEATRLACARMDRMREELRRRHGVMEIAVELIRDARRSASPAG